MTPYQLAVDLFRTGVSLDDVISRLISTGLGPSDARTAALAARPHAVADVLPDDARPAPRAERPQWVETLEPGGALPPAPAAGLQPAPEQAAAPAETPVRPGFHGWLLVATIVHGVYAAVTVLGLALFAVAAPFLVERRMRNEELALAGLHLALWVIAAVLLVSGVVLLLQRKRSARDFLIAWTVMCFILKLASFFFLDGSFTGVVIPLLWYRYFTRSKQLRATLTE